MPETYTQEQISEAVRECDRFVEKHYDKEIAPYVEILSYALSTAEQERDALNNREHNKAIVLDSLLSSIGEICGQPKPSVSDATMYIRALKSMADGYYSEKARYAELEARLQGAGKQWETFARKIWGSGRVMNVEQFVAEGLSAIVGRKEG